MGYAVFYFSFSDDRKQHLIDLLRSLIVQLAWKEPTLSMLQQAYEKPNQSTLTLDELQNILLSCFTSFDVVYLLLDALDECPEESDIRQTMLECLQNLSLKATHVKILATSRDLPEIRISMMRLEAEPMCIANRAVDADIRLYVEAQLKRDGRLSRLDPATRALIEETISTKADGMFRWAYCQLQELKKLKAARPKYVKEALNNLPKTLDATYERILIGIEEMYRREVIILLQWLAYADSPPTLSELSEAAIVDPEREGFIDLGDRGGLEDTLNLLSGLVVVVDRFKPEYASYDEHRHYPQPGPSVSDEGGDGESGFAPPEMSDFDVSEINSTYRGGFLSKDMTVRFGHFSVKEFLESNRILQSKAKEFYLEGAVGHKFLAQSCLAYLLHYNRSSEKSSTYKDFDSFPLLEYAARSWYDHSFLQESGEVALEVTFLTSETSLRDWHSVHQPDRPSTIPFRHDENVGSSIYHASFLGLETVVVELIRIGADLNAGTGYHGLALQAAAYQGYLNIAQILLDAGAEIDVSAGPWGNALCAAAVNGHVKMVQLLIDNGADVDYEIDFYDTALQIAARYGHEQAVRLLIDNGADVNARKGICGHALYSAAKSGYDTIVQLLIDKGANVNVQKEMWSSALQATSCNGHMGIVQSLMDNGADVNAHGGKYDTSVQEAARWGDEKMAKPLIDCGANFNAQGGHYEDALYAASSYGRVNIVRLLIDNGVDVNAFGSNALRAARQVPQDGEYVQVVKMLIEAGAVDEGLVEDSAENGQ